MAGSRSVAASRSAARAIDEELVVLTELAEPPRWVADWWCDRRGRRLRIERPTASLSGVPVRINGGFDRLTGQLLLVARPPAESADGPEGEGARVVAAIRDLPEDRAVLDLAGQAAAHLGARLLIAHAVPRSFAERNVGLERALEHGRGLLGAACDLARRDLPGLVVSARLFRTRPHELVSHPFGADLLVVGAPATRPLTSLDQVATAAVHHAQGSVLLVPKRAAATM